MGDKKNKQAIQAIEDMSVKAVKVRKAIKTEKAIQAIECMSAKVVENKAYRMIFYYPRNKERIINILNYSRSNSKIIGNIMCGNSIEIYETLKSNWSKIKCGDIIGYIKIEYGEMPIIPDDSTMYIS